MSQRSGEADFDFLLGKWTVLNRRRKVHSLYANPARNHEASWEEFPATIGNGVRQLDGNVITDYYEGRFPRGLLVKGMTIRAFDPATRLWSLVWLDNWQPPDFTPLVGKFEDGIGRFYHVVTSLDGKTLHVRFTWDEMSEETARWQQAFSLDTGVTWDTNWIMELTRAR